LLIGAVSAHATPKQDREHVLEYFKNKFPAMKWDNYTRGALAFSNDAWQQYESIMSFPPFETQVEKSQKMWETPFKNGKTYASCFPNGGKNIAGNYPRFDDKSGKVVTFEMALNACREKNGEKPYKYSSMKTIGLLSAYARSLSDGMLSNVKVVGPGATAAYEAGKHMFFSRHGQLNFSCATCHYDNAGNRIRSDLLSPLVGHTTHWPVFRAGERLFTLQRRYKGCNKNVRAQPFKIGSKEYNDLEYFESYMSNGLPLQANVFRK
jgi:sulfur-oxidizing protein SoxA